MNSGPQIVLKKKRPLHEPNVPLLGAHVRITFYQPVPGQTDDDPGTASCGRNLTPWKQVAVSRDLFYRPDGTKRCGERVTVVLEHPVRVHGKLVRRVDGMIWDTMNKRFHKTVDVLVGADEPARRYGAVTGWLR